MKKLEAEGASIPILIHPNAVIGEQVELESGTVVMAGAVINCCTKIGKGCIINTGATIDHDNSIEDYVHISPGAHLAGTVKVGQGSWLGIGSVVSNNVNITSGCKIGAGAVVVKDITEPGTYVGVPVRRDIKDEKKCLDIESDYATNMFKDQAGRHYWFAENLIERGYNPTVFCASTVHNSNENIDTGTQKYVFE